MEQRSRDAGSDGDQVSLSAEDFDLPGAGKLGEIDGASAANMGGGDFVGRDRRELGQEFARVDEEGVENFRRPFTWALIRGRGC